ncbi:MAG: polyketide synthase dehydratase domain-containing protein, partial [Verrucomicrobiota bacterium]
SSTDANLTDLSFTLLEGRHPLRYRSVLVVAGIDEATSAWSTDAIRGEAPRGFSSRPAMTAFAEKLIDEIRSGPEPERYREILHALAELYVQGYTIEWSALFEDIEPRRIHLPAYSFARDLYWVEETSLPAVEPAAPPTERLHRLVHRNTSDLSELRFTSRFTGDEEDLLARHPFQKDVRLPETAWLEMARAAMEAMTGMASEGRCDFQIRNMIWAEPIVIEGDGRDVHIALVPEDDDAIVFEIYTEGARGQDEVIHGQGIAGYTVSRPAQVLDLSGLKKSMKALALGPEASRDAANAWGLGAGYQGIEQILVGPGQGLARLEPSSGWLPDLLDSTMRAAVACVFHARKAENGHRRLFFPARLNRLEIMGGDADPTWAWIRWSDEAVHRQNKALKLDIDLCDDAGRVCVRLSGMTCLKKVIPVICKEAEAPVLSPPPSEPTQVALADPAHLAASFHTGKARSSVLKPVDVLSDLKAAMPSPSQGLVPTLNRTGVMTEELIPCSRAFADFAGQCDGEVLDIGCAYGVATIAALERGARVLAVDMEPQHLAILEDRLNDEAKVSLTLLEGVLPDIDFDDER